MVHLILLRDKAISYQTQKINILWSDLVFNPHSILQYEAVDAAALGASCNPDLNITLSRILHSCMKEPIIEYIWN